MSKVLYCDSRGCRELAWCSLNLGLASQPQAGEQAAAQVHEEEQLARDALRSAPTPVSDSVTECTHWAVTYQQTPSGGEGEGVAQTNSNDSTWPATSPCPPRCPVTAQACTESQSRLPNGHPLPFSDLDTGASVSTFAKQSCMHALPRTASRLKTAINSLSINKQLV